MKKFEYKELFYQISHNVFKKPHCIIKEDYLKDLNDEGKKGWEIVSILPLNTNGYTYDLKIILKREISSTDKSIF